MGPGTSAKGEPWPVCRVGTCSRQAWVGCRCAKRGKRHSNQGDRLCCCVACRLLPCPKVSKHCSATRFVYLGSMGSCDWMQGWTICSGLFILPWAIGTQSPAHLPCPAQAPVVPPISGTPWDPRCCKHSNLTQHNKGKQTATVHTSHHSYLTRLPSNPPMLLGALSLPTLAAYGLFSTQGNVCSVESTLRHRASLEPVSVRQQ